MYFLLKDGNRHISAFSFYLFKLLGLAPIGCRFVVVDGHRSVVFSNCKLGTFHNLLLCGIVLGSVSYRLYYLVGVYATIAEPSSSIFFLICDAVYSSLGIVVVLLAMCLRQSSLRSLWSLGASIQRRLPQRRRKNRLHARFTAVLAMIVAQMFGVLALALNVDIRGLPFAGKICSAFNMIGYFVVCTQYSMLARLIADALDQTSLDLKILLETRRRPPNYLATLESALDAAQKLYESLIELADRMADFYSPIMLPTVARYLVFIASHFYLLSKMLLNEETRRPEFRIYIGSSLYLFMPILMISALAAEAITQNKKYVKTLTDILHKFDYHDSIQNQVDVCLRYTFSNRVSFRVYDLFVIDNSLLLTIIGTSCTSCIILLQLYTPPNV
ncbi:hypothetical protein TKK_0007110 [Trichogramma kaykai]